MALLVCAAACSIITKTLPAFFQPESFGKAAQRTLTFAERVVYQRAIEDVYWRHRIWPMEHRDPKPPLDAVMSQAQLEKKVVDYLWKSQALDDYWHRPITAEQLQAEMDRMATHTKQPQVLNELFDALGNDPFVIAECLARPALAERLLTTWYAYDQRIHAELKQRAWAELQSSPAVGQMKQLGGKYSEIELVKSDNAQEKIKDHTEHGVKLSSHDWDQTVQKLAAIFDKGGLGLPNGRDSVTAGSRLSRSARPPVALYQSFPVGKVSSVQEDESRYYALIVASKTEGHLKLTTVSWLKEPLASWRASTQSQMFTALAEPAHNYTLPGIRGGDCTDDSWTPTAGPPDGRQEHTAIWTGSEMVVWGGVNALGKLDTGGRYNAATDTWTATSDANAPTARSSHTAVWTGIEMIIWGGIDENFAQVNTGGKYNPDTDSWVPTSLNNVPDPRYSHTAVWSGTEMIVWAGSGELGFLNTGGRYAPHTDSWTDTSTIDVPTGRDGHTAVWTGSEMIVWGGFDEDGTYSSTGGRYNPDTNSWTATSRSNPPPGRRSHTAVWTGSEMIIWGGFSPSNGGVLNTGGRYDPDTNSWTATSMINVPHRRDGHTAIWSENEMIMIIWGGSDENFSRLNTGARYDPTANTWIATNTTDAPSARDLHTAIWTGSEMVVWGGTGDFQDVNTGGRYDPGTDSWVATSSAPSSRYFHTAVWTGTEMIIWGGYLELNTGGRYNLSTDSWTATSTINAPDGRYSHTAVWTGTEMIVWGGGAFFTYFDTGGRYNPTTDSWVATSTSNAPSGRTDHTAVWSGNEMIVWGGYNGSDLNTGGKYDPITDSWIPTGTTNAPESRDSHTAVWTDNQMIVWGGAHQSLLNSGSRYDPSTNTWAATSTTNAPDARYEHTAVWNGTEMIIWGGSDLSNYLDTGGRYNAGADSWIPTNTSNAPSGRYGHTTIWSGNEMIVWGGYFFDGNNNYANTGGRYSPGTNSWVATNTINAPNGRYHHTAIWSGNEMIIWGGTNDTTNFNSGGKYCAQSGPPPSPTPTPSATVTPTTTPTITPTATPTATSTPTQTPRVSPTPRTRPTARPRPTPPPHNTPVPPPPSPRPTAWPRPTSPPHLTPVPTPSSPRPTPWPRP